MINLEYIIFDFDGTLVDSMPIGLDIYNQIAEKYDFKAVTEDNIDEIRELSVLNRLGALGVPIYRIPFLALEFHKLFKNSMDDLEFFPGIKTLLEELDDLDYKVAIISSNSAENIKDFLEKEELSSIEKIFSSTSLFGKDKVINKFLKKNNLAKSDVIYVGDEERDILSCKKLGVEVIWVSWGFDLLEVARNEEPDYIVDEPREILEIISS